MMDGDRSWIDSLPVMVFRSRWGDQRPILRASAGCLALTGYTMETLQGGSFDFNTLIHPHEREKVRQKLTQAAQQDWPYELTYRIITARGEARWVREQGQFHDMAGEVIVNAILSDYQAQMVKMRFLEQRVADRSGRLAALYDILEAVSDAAALSATCERILQRLLQAIDLDAGAIHLFDQSRENLDLVAQSGLPAAVIESNSKLHMQESPLVGWIASQGKPLLIPQIDRDQRSLALAESTPYTLYTGVPISASERIYGVLSLLDLEDARPRVGEAMDLLLSVGEQIGVVVENAQLREDAQQLQIVEERNRLARELHDSVTQSLYSVNLFAEAGRRMIEQGDTDQAAVYLADVAHTGRQALKEMRLLVHRLRPSILAQEGLVRAIKQRLNAVEGRAAVHHQLIVEGDLNLSPRMEEAIYHIIQEALNNALKHSAANEVVVSLRAQENGRLDVQIIDDGRGFDIEQAAEMGGLGLTSMRERVEMFGGTLTCSSAPGQGTTIHAYFPQI